jgi:predicted CXXCH cytochrome family protein
VSLTRLAFLAVAVYVVGDSPGFAHPAIKSPKPSKASAAAGATSLTYVGSDACRTCHEAIYDRWQRSRMANVVRDPKVHPDAIIPDLSKPNPLVTFTAPQIAFVYGSRWKQRYFTRIDDDYFPLPAQWDITHHSWKPYSVASGTDWWVPFYPTDNMKRPTGPLCDGCHSVGYDPATKKVQEWNVGCEKCHGPGHDHVEHPARTNIIDPAKLDGVAANDVCIQCHSQGRPTTNPVAGRVYDWPVGFRVGLALRDFWRLEEHRLGETTFTHFADGSAHKNRMQGNDFVQSVMYSHGITCADCHDAHGSEHGGSLAVPAQELCQQCHSPGGKNGPRARTLEQHTHHLAASTGSSCIACHMPEIAQTIGDVMLHSHTFRFLPPSLTVNAKIPNPCTLCHKDKSNEWASAALRGWPGISPWRVAP